MLFCNKGLIRHLIIWKTLHFKALIQLWLSEVKAPALPKERWRKGFVSFLLPKVGAQNRVPSKHLAACEGSNPSVRSFLSSLSQLTFAAMVDKISQEEKERLLSQFLALTFAAMELKISEEEKERLVSQFLARQGLPVRMSIQILEEGLEKKAEKLRGLRVGSGAVGLVLSLPMVLDLCSVLFSNACLCDSSAAW